MNKTLVGIADPNRDQALALIARAVYLVMRRTDPSCFAGGHRTEWDPVRRVGYCVKCGSVLGGDFP